MYRARSKNLTKINCFLGLQRLRTWFAVLAISAVASASAVDFAGTGVGTIPDNNPTGLNVSFNTAGFQGPVGHVRITVNLTHTFIGDLRATLISPGQKSQLVLFSRTGYKRASAPGVTANLSGSYVFDDQLGGDLWATIAPLTTAQTVPPGAYRTSTAGASLVSDIGGCSTHLDLAFGGLQPAADGGIWTLRFVDSGNGDVGSVNSATLTLEPTAELFNSGFESGFVGPAPAASSAVGSCKKAFFDFTGDGRTDFVTVRNTGGGSAGAITWTVTENTGTGTGTVQSFEHGRASNFFLDGDFDGDGIADATYWDSSTGAYVIRRSSRPTSRPLEILFGKLTDIPSHIGDYDGDGVADVALYRNGAVPTPSLFMIRLSASGDVRSFPIGDPGNYASGGIDLNGDQKADVIAQGNAGGGLGRIRLYDGTTGVNFLDQNFGTPTDSIVSGNHAGDSRGDITVVRSANGTYRWSTREVVGAVQADVDFGSATTDRLLGGDYDGDGIDDHAVWRTVTPQKFIIRRSTNTAMPLEILQGTNGDFPLANSRVN